jgi:hypothetical protein
MSSHWPCICTYLLTRGMRKLEGEVGDKTMLFTCTPCNRVLGALSPAASVTPLMDTIRIPAHSALLVDAVVLHLI